MALGKMALLLVLLILLSATQPSLAQQSNGTSRHRSRTAGGLTPSTVVMIVVVIAVLVLITLFSLYMNGCTCTRTRAGRPLPRRPFHSAATPHSDHCRPRGGLDLELVEAFPTAVYGDVKAHITKLFPLECAVCLAEFADADELRVLPACCHVFHPGCIGPWLAGAATCPLCRADLTAETGRQQQQDEERSVASITAESLSTGMDRHTLRLPEHVMEELGAVRRHRRGAAECPDDAADQQRTPAWVKSLLRSMSGQRRHRAESEAGEEHGGGSRRIYPVTGEPVETPSGSSGYGGDEKKESSDVVDAFSRV